jgi:hypothetical protein
MESINYTEVESITASFAGGDSPRIGFTHNFYDKRKPVTVDHGSWLVAVKATREVSGDEFFSATPARPSRKRPSTLARLSAFEGDSPYKNAESVTVTPNGLFYTTMAPGLPIQTALWNPTRRQLTPWFMGSRANAPTEQITYSRQDQKAINLALQHRRMAASWTHVSIGRAEGGNQDTDEGGSGASMVGAVGLGEGSLVPPAGRDYWDPVRNV